VSFLVSTGRKETFMSNPEERRMKRVRRRLSLTAVKLMESLDEDTINAAPLNQRAAALGIVLDRLMKLHQTAEKSSEEEVLRIEYRDPDGSIHSTPYWAREDRPDREGELAVHGRRLWEAFRKNGDGEDLDD
jgi:hypothetical protein